MEHTKAEQVELLSLDEAAKLLRISSRSLSDRRYRERLGLGAQRIGRRLLFAKVDVLTVIERGREEISGVGQKTAGCEGVGHE